MTTKVKKTVRVESSATTAEKLIGFFPDCFLLLSPTGKIIYSHIPEPEKFLLSDGKFDTQLLKKIKQNLPKTSFHSYLRTEILIGGKNYWYEARMQKMQDNAVFIVIRNITGIISEVDKRDRFYEVTEQSQELVMITNVAGMIEYVNPMVLKVTGYTNDELAGKNVNVLKSEKHSREFYFNLWDTILQGKSYKGEFYNTKKNGDIFVEEKIITPLFNYKGEIINFISTGIDITLKKQLDSRTRKYRKLKETIDKKGQKSRTLSLIKSNERERSELARAIHEGVNQMLTATMANVEALGERRVISQEEKGRIELINQMISEITQELRGISGNLSPMGLYKFGLYLAVQQMVSRKATVHGFKAEFKSNLAKLRFKNEIEITIYRIVEEALSNIEQHASAKKVTVWLNYENNLLSLLVKDNGRGIAMNKLGFKKLSTFGILNIEALAKSIGAALNIKTGIDKGFSIGLSLNTKIISHD